MNFKVLRQSPRQNKLDSSNKVNTIRYRCGNVFSLEESILAFVFGLQPAIQKIVAHKVERLSKERRTFENVMKIARKDGETYQARLIKPEALEKNYF